MYIFLYLAGPIWQYLVVAALLQLQPYNNLIYTEAVCVRLSTKSMRPCPRESICDAVLFVFDAIESGSFGVVLSEGLETSLALNQMQTTCTGW